MAAISGRSTLNPLLLPEIVGLVVENVPMVPDLLSCACVNSIWNVAALKRLYTGSLNDMQFCTPDIGSLNCLFVASRERFARNMSFVKHLLLSPEAPAIDGAAYPEHRLACFEKCRAMRHRQYAELLLRPKGRGLKSLTIPFEIDGQDWSLISDLLLTPTVEFLAIDNYYCELLTVGSSYSREPIISADKFSNLKALTVYKSASYLEIDELCQLLQSCDLQFFHLEERCQTESLTSFNTVKLLSCLRQQQNLKALALILPHCDPPLESVSAEEHGIPWPRLKALYLGQGDQHWLGQFPNFKGLQILSLQKLTSGIPTVNQNAIKNIAKCQHLQAIDIVFHKPVDLGALLDIARGCPLLQKLSVRPLKNGRTPELTENRFSSLLRALPRLEFLELDLKFQMDGAKLQDLSRHCPQLTVLGLSRACLYLSLAVMRKAHPLQQLKIMHFARIWFKDPRRLMKQDKIQSIATEWRRIFPKLQEKPCPADVYFRYMQEEYLSEESEDDRASADAEMPLSEPGLDFDDYGTDWFNLRTKLWRALGYGKDLDINDKIQYMWQTNLEIETIGWPVVPLEAFSDPVRHSTTANYTR
ncbi:hypothetical protein MaudCBS49596_005969 [Microsporum audouinii]